jgi:hypothetical protein
MKAFGWEFSVKAKKAADTVIQLKPNDGQGPYSKYFQSFIARKIEPTFYEFLREAIPIVDAGINKLVNLDGHIEIEGDNGPIVDELKDWIYNVPVNDLQKGLQAFHQNLTGEGFEQGFSLGEFVTNKKRNDIIELRVADSKFIRFARKKDGSGGIDIFQKSDEDTQERVILKDNLIYFSINNENQNPYGVPLLRSCEFVSQILVTMQNSIKNTWERFGDPSYFLKYKTSSRKDSISLEDRRKKLSTDLNTAVRAKMEGKTADFVTAVDKDSDMTLEIVGAEGNGLEIEMPARHVLEQIVSKIGLPAWMLGLNWNTTQGLSDNEAELILSEVSTRQSAKTPYFYNLCRTLLLLRGRTWKKGDWHLKWAQVNLRDILKQAQARFMDAQADMYYLQNCGAAGIPLDISQLALGNYKGVKARFIDIKQHEHDVKGCKVETTRPFAWPGLDTLENDYLKELVFEWGELKRRVMLLLKIPVKMKSDTPLDKFEISIEQRAMIMQSLKDWIATFSLGAEDSSVTWYYGQAFSLGLIKAVQMLGKDRPILDLIKSKEIFDELCKDGFKLLKDNATKAIVNDILPAIDAHVIAGSGPIEIAAVLEKLFENKNSDWERLSRSELAMAAETAKLEEWQQWDVKTVEFIPAPDGCPACFAISGVYPIGNCPLPVRDTHPRCRCSITFSNQGE